MSIDILAGTTEQLFHLGSYLTNGISSDSDRSIIPTSGNMSSQLSSFSIEVEDAHSAVISDENPFGFKSQTDILNRRSQCSL